VVSFRDLLGSWLPGSRAKRAAELEDEARADELRRLYLEHFNEEPRSLSQRVAYHLYHLMLYWSRWVGFQDAVKHSEPPITGSLMLMVQVGTDLSGEDVLAYCDEANADDLRSAWIAYRAALSDICDGTTGAREAIYRGHAAFRHVDELRQAKGLLHYYEAERDAERDVRPGT
jgi:hypothetical protein